MLITSRIIQRRRRDHGRAGTQGVGCLEDGQALSTESIAGGNSNDE